MQNKCFNSFDFEKQIFDFKHYVKTRLVLLLVIVSVMKLSLNFLCVNYWNFVATRWLQSSLEGNLEAWYRGVYTIYPSVADSIFRGRGGRISLSEAESQTNGVFFCSSSLKHWLLLASAPFPPPPCFFSSQRKNHSIYNFGSGAYALL